MSQGPDIPGEIDVGRSYSPDDVSWMSKLRQIGEVSENIGVIIRYGVLILVGLMLVSTIYANVVEIGRLKDRVEELEKR